MLNGKLEETNEAYAIAKIAGLKMCESFNRQYNTDYRSLMPTNMFGPGDNYHKLNSHVMAALIRKFIIAYRKKHKSVVVWGSGKPKREFLCVDDMARASIYLMNLDKNSYDEQVSSELSHINVGSGEDLTIRELAEIIKEVVGFKGEIKFDPTRPDGNPRKLLDSNRINNLGFKPEITLRDGLMKTYENYIKS